MPQLRIGLAQINPTVGDLAANARSIRRQTADAAGRGCHLVAFGEMALTGYPPEDLVLRHAFVEASKAELERLAAGLVEDGLGEIGVIVGYLDAEGNGNGGQVAAPRNSAAFLLGGRVWARYAKHHLPNYGVFDEFRYFAAGNRLPIVRFRGVDLTMIICEDLWQDGGPLTAVREAACPLVICVNGSPYERGKIEGRVELAGRRAREAGAMIAYVNLVGGQDELVFDGGSFVVDAGGTLRARAPQFVEGVLTFDVDLPAGWDDRTGSINAQDGTWVVVERTDTATAANPTYQVAPVGIAPGLGDEAEVWQALVTGTRDYVTKNGFGKVLLGLSGGIDSAVVATIAVDAIGAENVLAVSMPSVYSSEHSRSDAAELAKRQGMELREIPIAAMVAAYQQAADLSGLAEENLQARVRGTLLMGLSNAGAGLVLTTGNKSELATGYSTLYGDSAGGFAPIKDVPKTLVWELAKWRNAEAEAHGHTPPIPVNSILKPPSAELRPDQLDSDSLPPYAELDAILAMYVDSDAGRDQIIAAGHEAEVVDRVISLVDGAEYKRRQYPPGPKISLKAFGRDRRLPLTNRFRSYEAQRRDS